jgi:hypothetical protein
MIVVVNRRTGAPAAAVYVGRPSPLGNPFHIGPDGSRADVIRKYRTWLQAQPDSSPAIRELLRLVEKHRRDGTLYLSCWCAPAPCHADIIKQAIELIEAQRL